MPSDPAEAVKPSPSKRNEWLFAIALLAATLIAYHPAWFGKPVWDDDAHLTGAALRSWNGLWKIWVQPGATQQYYPLVHSVFWIEYHLWGYAPLGYHLVNILLHVANALLLVQILRRLGIPGAWLAGAIFALHPIEVESVAWISELKNTLSGAFYLGAALAYLHFDRGRKWRFYFLALALFVAGLFCKTVIASLPAALLVMFWWKRGSTSWKRDVQSLIPFFIVGIAMGLFTAHVEKNLIIGPDAQDFRFTVAQRCLIAGRALWFYVVKLLWPAKLVFIYPRWELDASAWWQWLFPAAALAVGTSLWMLRKRSRGPLAAALFYGGTLFPALGFVNVYPFVYSFVADHFQYLAGIGIITFVAAGAASLWARNTAAQISAVVMVAALAALTWWQCRIYTDVEALYTNTLENNPGCWLAWNNLGNELLAKGKVDEAIEHYQHALDLKPDYGKAENNLGDALYAQNKVDEAIKHFQKALQLRPDLPDAYNSLGNIELRANHLDYAITLYKKALHIQPSYIAAGNGLGYAFYKKGDMDRALAEYFKALDYQPDFALTLNNIGTAYMGKGDVKDAMVYFEKALASDPNNLEALNNLAWLLSTWDSSTRNGARAVELAEKANRLSGGDDVRYLGTLAAAYAEAGRFGGAVDAAEHALSLATAKGDLPMVKVLDMELRFYRDGKPFHQIPQ